MPQATCPQCHRPLGPDSVDGLCRACSPRRDTPAPAATPPSVDTQAITARYGAGGAARQAGVDTWTCEPGCYGAEPHLPAAPDGYDLLRWLGGGGMGDVYLAREHVAERLVAMKFLRGAASPGSVERFLAEVRALARLDHPNIVGFITVELNRVQPYFTMEYAPGGALSGRVKADGPLPPAEAARIMAVSPGRSTPPTRPTCYTAT